MERGVVHAERRQHPVVQEGGEILPGDHGHQMAEDVGGDGVVPRAAGLGDQRHGGGAFHHLTEGGLRGLEIDPVGAVERIDRVRLHEAVGQPGGMGHQVVEVMARSAGTLSILPRVPPA